MITLYSIVFVIALLAGFVVAASMARHGWNVVPATLAGVIVSVGGGALVAFTFINHLKETAIALIQTQLPVLIDKAVTVLTIYAQAKG